jgi:flavin-dependent dehydrogenase
VLNRIRRIEVFSRSRTSSINLGEPDLVIEREKLVRHLARLAESAGARIITSTEFRGLESPPRKNGKVVLHLRNLSTGETVRETADILVGADGHSSAVGSALQKKRSNGAASLVQARIPLPSSVSSDTTRAWFDPGLTPYFIWLIPESADTAVAGTIAETRPRAFGALSAFLRRHKFRPLEFQAAPAPLHHFRSDGNLASPSRSVFVVGDAAGQVKATTVGGLVTGLRGAASLSSALLNGRHYHRELRPLKRELDLHLLARFVLNTFTPEDYDRLLSLVNGRLSRFLSLWSRDELAKSIWRLLLSEPRLLSLALKAWLRKAL